jgi:hypothetical protein
MRNVSFRDAKHSFRSHWFGLLRLDAQRASGCSPVLAENRSGAAVGQSGDALVSCAPRNQEAAEARKLRQGALKALKYLARMNLCEDGLALYPGRQRRPCGRISIFLVNQTFRKPADPPARSVDLRFFFSHHEQTENILRRGSGRVVR